MWELAAWLEETTASSWFVSRSSLVPSASHVSCLAVSFVGGHDQVGGGPGLGSWLPLPTSRPVRQMTLDCQVMPAWLGTQCRGFRF